VAKVVFLGAGFGKVAPLTPQIVEGMPGGDLTDYGYGDVTAALFFTIRYLRLGRSSISGGQVCSVGNSIARALKTNVVSFSRTQKRLDIVSALFSALCERQTAVSAAGPGALISHASRTRISLSERLHRPNSSTLEQPRSETHCCSNIRIPHCRCCRTPRAAEGCLPAP
jgi:hypothetical protein